jgi:hypothetical protein
MSAVTSAPIRRSVRARALEALVRYGLAQTMRKAAMKLVRTAMYHRDQVIVFSVSQKPAENLDRSLDLAPVEIEELLDLLSHHPELADTASQAQERFATGDRCFVARRNGQLAHMAWIGQRSEITATTEVGQTARVRATEPVMYIYDCWTSSRFRGQGIYPTVLRQLIRQGLESHREVWIGSRVENSASIRGIYKAGFRPRYRLGRVSLLHGVSWSWVKREGCE